MVVVGLKYRQKDVLGMAKKETKTNEYVMLDPKDIFPYENNPRINDAAVDYLVNSIRELGFGAPILVDKDRVIIAGHTRQKAALKLGLKEVPVVILKDITKEQARAMRLADNKVPEASGWNLDLLDIELDSLKDVFDMEDFGFLDNKYEEFDVDEDDDIPVETEGTADERFGVLVEFPSQDAQREFFDRMVREGMDCRCT